MGKKADREMDEAIRQRAYERVDKKGNRIVGLNLGLQGRTVQRLRRCENCMHFDRGTVAANVYKSCYQRATAAMREKGMTEAEIDAELKATDQFMAAHVGQFGACTHLASEVTTDMVHKDHLCHWHTQSGPGSFKAEHGPLDPLDDELRDRVGAPQLDDQGQPLRAEAPTPSDDKPAETSAETDSSTPDQAKE